MKFTRSWSTIIFLPLIWLVAPARGMLSAINIATLRSTPVIAVSNGTPIFVSGYYAQNDGGGGTFSWTSTSTASDNGGTIIQPTGTATGRWILQWQTIYSVRQFGAKGDGSTDDSTAFSNCIVAATAARSPIFVPASTAVYVVNNIALPSYCRIMGQTSNAALGGGPILQTNTVNGAVFTVASGATEFRVSSISAQANALGASAITFNGGDHFLFEYSAFQSLSTAPVCNVTGSILFFKFSHCDFSNGSYTFYVPAVANFGTMGDGFDQCTFGGWATNSFYLASTVISANWKGCFWTNYTGGNSTILFASTAGCIVPCSLIDCAGEGSVGHSQKTAYTTGTISASSNSLSVASATGLVNGRGITIQGAGYNACDLTTTISSISGTAITLAAPAVTSVSNADVAEADYSFLDNQAGGSVNVVCWNLDVGEDTALYMSNRCAGTFFACSCARPIYSTNNIPIHVLGYGYGVQGAPVRTNAFNAIQQGIAVGSRVGIGSPMFALGPSGRAPNGSGQIDAAPFMQFALVGTYGGYHGDFDVTIDSPGRPEIDAFHVYGDGSQIAAGAPLSVPSYAYNALPTAKVGAHIFVTGSGQSGWGTQLNGTSSGSNSFPAWSDGSHWYIG